MRKKIVYFSFILFAGCTASKMAMSKGPILTQADADRAAIRFPGATLASLESGKIKYEETCGKCHGLKSVTWGDEAAWLEIIPPMSEKAAIDAGTQDLITQYLVTSASAAK